MTSETPEGGPDDRPPPPTAEGAPASPPPQAAGHPAPPPPDRAAPDPKKKTTAGLLAIFLGSLGIHRFYLGFTTLGLVMVLITVLSLFILAPIVAVWGIVDGILIFTGVIDRDAEGVKLV
jgi:TM2 domain-containing membrane protein YozV